MTRKKYEFEWRNEQQAAFELAKETIQKALDLWPLQKGEVELNVSVNGCPKITAFYPKAPTIMPAPHGPDHPRNPSPLPGQPVLVELPTVGAVPLVLDTPISKYTWKAKDAHGKEHKINTR